MGDRGTREVPLNWRLAVTGANSAVGRAMLHLPEGDRAEVTGFVACVRSERAESELPPLPGTDSRVARISYDDADSLIAAFTGCDAVAHLPGVLIERAGSTYEIANVETTRAVARAAAELQVKKLVLVSAVGADSKSDNRYYRTKGEAEDIVRRCGVPYTILRAPLLLGPDTEGSEQLRRNGRKHRRWLLGGGRNVQQPIHVDDMANAVLRAADQDLVYNRTLDMVGTHTVTERELALLTSRSMGIFDIKIRPIPIGLARAAAALRTRLSGPGFSPDAIEVITASTELPTSGQDALSMACYPIQQMIRDTVLKRAGR